MNKKVYNKKKSSTYGVLTFLTNTKKFKIIVCLAIILGLYGSITLSANIDNYFSSFLNAFQFSTFNLLFFIIIFLNTIYICTTFNQYDSYIIRLKDKKKYIKELIKLTCCSNLIIIAIVVFSFLMVLNLLKIQYFFPETYYGYINNISYSIFYLIRYVILIILLSIINVILYYKFGEKKLVIIDLFFCSIFPIYYGPTMDSIEFFSILPWRYFRAANYGNFTVEVCYSLLYILILELSILVLYKNINKKRKKYLLRGGHHYIFLHDCEVIIRKNYKMLLFLIFVPVFFLGFVTLKYSTKGIDILIVTLGLHFSKSTLIGKIMFIFHIIIFLFIAIYLYICDLKNNLDYLFLRMKIVKWFYSKELFLIVLTFILKLIQYMFVSMIIYWNGKKGILSNELILFFFTDYFVTLILQQIFIILYFAIYLFAKGRYFIIAIFLGFIMFVPKDIVWYSPYIPILVVLNILLLLLESKFYQIHRRKIMEIVGGIS